MGGISWGEGPRVRGGGACRPPGFFHENRVKMQQGAIRSWFISTVSPVFALVFWLSGLRQRVLTRNFRIMGIAAPGFYRFRLGFRLARALLALALPGRLSPAALHPRSRAHLDRLRAGPSLLLTAHFGNWEAQAAAWRGLGVDLLGAARPLRSRIAHGMLSRLRARHGIRVVTTAVPRTALRHLTPTPNFPGGCFGLLWDQHAPDSVRPGTFFGEPVSLNPLPFFLLAKHPRPVYFGVLLPGGTLRLLPLLPPAPLRAGWEDRLARRYHRVLETLIRRHPTHAFGLLHARFKMTRTYVGHRGKSAPKAWGREADGST
jgi:lauroyl/myristoyl acyltransferase